MSATLDLSPVELNLVFVAGDRVTFTMPVTDSDGDPYDLSGSTVVARARAGTASSNTRVTFDAEVDESTITVVLDEETTATMSGQWTYAVRVDSPDSGPRTVVGGRLVVREDALR